MLAEFSKHVYKDFRPIHSLGRIFRCYLNDASLLPRAGQVLMCDFKGFEIPEMVKVRPVIVVSPRLPYRSDIVAIVPISLTAPKHVLPFCHRLSKNYHPEEADDLPCWAKADMIMNLGAYRLNGFKVGRRKWEYPQVSGEDLAGVRHAILCGLGLDRVEKKD